MIKRRHLIASLPAAFLSTTALGQTAGPGQTGSTPDAKASRELRIGYQRNGALLLAKQQGLLEQRFRAQGVGLKWVEFSYGPPLLEALNVGSIDYGTAGDAPPIFAQAARANVLYIAVAEDAGSSSAILVPPGSGLASLADLRGRRVGFARASSAHSLTIAAVEKAGLAWSDITPVQLAPADARVAFERGALDAWTIWDPYFAVAEARTGVRILAPARDIARQNSFFLANADYARRNPDIVAATNEELARIAVWADGHRDEVAKANAEATGIDLAIWQRAVARSQYRVRPLEDRVVGEQQAVADRFLRLGLIPDKIAVRDIVWKWDVHS